jgi:general secretion pathway protein C
VAHALLFRVYGVPSTMLELFFQKYAWTANVALLFAAAWISAKTVNTVVGAAIRGQPRVDLSGPAAAPARQQLLARLDPDKLYPLIGQKAPEIKLEDESDLADAGAKNCNDRDAAPLRSSLSAQLVAGTIVEPAEWSLASILDLSTRQTQLYTIGDTILGAKLISVEPIRDDTPGLGADFKIVAVICNNGAKEFIDSEAGGASPSSANLGVAPVPSPISRADAGGPAPSPAGAFTKIAENRYSVPKSFIDGSLANINKIATEARLVPNFKAGTVNGFKVFAIQPASLYASMGLENGDVIQRINGYEINAPDKVLEIYSKLKDSSHVSIELERKGQAIRKEYNITP